MKSNILERTHDHITALCRKHGVRHLYAFGSVLTPRFTDHSDVDFLVDFDTAVIFGPELSPSVLADIIGTIPYEILTSVSPRVKRVYYLD